MQQRSHAEEARYYARLHYVEPARRRRDQVLRIVSGEVHKALGLVNLYPTVCQALAGPKFLKENHLVLENRDGPPSGLGPRVTFTYRLLPEAATEEAPENSPFLRLRGAGKEVFASLGGGEVFIRREREHFYGPDGEDA
jgi:hypothetical protein